jgi:transposase
MKRNQEVTLSYSKQLREDQWERIRNALPGKSSDPGRTAHDNRRLVEAVMWVARNGARGRPAEGVRPLELDPPALSPLVAAGSVADAFQHPGRQRRYRFDHRGSSTGCGRKRGPQNQALGRSRGGLSTKIHAACDSHGNPLRFILTAGSCADYDSASGLLEGLSAQAVIADKGYDSDRIVAFIGQMGAQAVIPPRCHRLTPRTYDRHLYKERNLIERLFNRLKNFRCLSTRYDKTALSFLSFLHLFGAFLWLQ